MKIAFINIYQGEAKRGLETFVNELVKRIEGDDQVDIFGGGSKPLARWPYLWRFYIDPHGVKIALYTLKILPKLWKEKYDIVLPLNGGWQPALIRLLTWLTGGKMVIPGQSGIGWDDRNNLWCFPDAFVALTPKAKRWAKKANPLLGNIVMIPNGVDLTSFKQKGRKYPTKLKKPIILCVGALTPQKRIDLVIDAVAKLKNASLLIAGDGELKQKLIEKGKKLLGDRFRLVSVKHRQMPEVYRAADLFTLVPEESEAFGIVYVEAIASNLPVIAIDDEQRREIIGDAGLFIDDPTKIDLYANTLREALSKKWGDKPRKQAEKYDWDEIADQYEQLFESLLDES
jgi:glycosyltransferase involved in cell wall biosynthesis